jgi:DNA (cytosine-5)-methyltransferase 1
MFTAVNYYNEYDKKTAAWLRELIKAGLIPDGVVDERSITDVRSSDLAGYTQCHFFAGIGGWSLALQLAGWPSDRPVWTGSCPCQPFSTAGKGLAQADERHLWPVFFNLIKDCRPEHVFGEQVASAIGKGWLDGISADLGEEGYACGSAVLGAHSVGSPHIRQRLYWVADSNSGRFQQCDEGIGSVPELNKNSADGWMGDSSSERHNGQHSLLRKEEPRRDTGDILQAAGSCEASGMGNAERQQYERRGGAGDVGCPPDQEQGEARQRERSWDANSGSGENDHGMAESNALGWTHGFDRKDDQRAETASECSGNLWSDFQLAHCRDGKTRRIPTEPTFFPLAHGVSARVVRLRGYGNAIVPQIAAEFAKAYLEISQ